MFCDRIALEKNEKLFCACEALRKPDYIGVVRRNNKEKKMKKVIAVIMALVLGFSVVGISDFRGKAVMADEVAIDVSKLKVEDMLDMDGLVGWATVASDGVDAVTGGGNVTPVLVSDYESLNALTKDNLPRVIIISGTIDTVGKAISVGSNKTIIGLDKNTLIKGGFTIKNSCNVILSNLNIQGVWPVTSLPDCIDVENCHHIWMDHLNVWDAPDGNLDIKGSSNYITVSWSKFWYTSDLHEHRLSNLVSSGTGNDATELHQLNVTYHHNWFADNVSQRMPRLLYGRSHIYNNYYTAEGNDYCVGVGCYASALIEQNYFKNVKNPHQFMYQGIIPTYITARNNIYDNTTGKQDNGYAAGNSHFKAMEVEKFDNPPYTYYPDAAEDVPAIVEAYAGPRNILEENTNKPERKPEVTPIPTEEPILPTPAPTPTAIPEVDDNPISYDSENGIYNYNGQNSDSSNGRLYIKNPFAGMDLSETYETNKNGSPKWTNGVTISYWVKLTENATDIPVLNFNLAGKREISLETKNMYETCKEAECGTGSYKLGNIEMYLSMTRKFMTVISSQGRYSRYNPLYPSGAVYKKNASGNLAVYSAGADLTKSESYITVSDYGEGYYQYYGRRYDEENGEKSLLSEAYVDGSLSLYASGSAGFAADSGNAVEINPNLSGFGKRLDVDKQNYFRYWGNGGNYSYNRGLKTPTMEKKDEWHFVVTVIKNDWIQTYMDGISLGSEYLNTRGSSINNGLSGTDFNLGYGSKLPALGMEPTSGKSYGKTMLDLITDENTTLCIGGDALAASKLGQNDIKTVAGAQIKDIRFYAVALNSENIGKERVQTFTSGWSLKGTELEEIEADTEPVPTIVSTATPEPTPKPTVKPTTVPTAVPTVVPTPYGYIGDINHDSIINAEDALLALKHAAKLQRILDVGVFMAADTTGDGIVDASDALKILKYAAKLINEM